MKVLLAFAAAGLLAAATAHAQTVLPSGAVAPAGAVVEPSGVLVSPATVPGSQPVVTPDLRDGGSVRAHRRDEKIPGLNRQDRKQVRKMSKVKYSADAEKQGSRK